MRFTWRTAVVVAASGIGATALWIGYTRWRERPDAHVDVYDGFEGRQLSRLWETSRFEPGAVTIDSQTVRAGHGAARVVLTPGAIFEKGIKGSKDSERAELLEAPRLVAREGRLYEYQFSQFLPAGFPIVPVRLVLAQWKQDCRGHEPCSDDSPVVALRYIGGKLSITRQNGRHQVDLFAREIDLRGQWSDYRFVIRFSLGTSGLVQAWRNGEQVVDYHGPTAYEENEQTGYNRPSVFYFKMGLYRDLMSEPMTIYLDEYRKRELPDAR